MSVANGRYLVLVTGYAAAGKTTLAPRIAEDLDALWISRAPSDNGSAPTPPDRSGRHTLDGRPPTLRRHRLPIRLRDAAAVVTTNLIRVAYKIVDPALLTAGPGPHPAASPFDKRVSEALGIGAFEVYRVELPPGAETVRHNHLDDGVEDLYFTVSGAGWVVIDDDHLPVRPGLFVAVTVESARQVRADSSGLAFVAICSAPR